MQDDSGESEEMMNSAPYEFDDVSKIKINYTIIWVDHVKRMDPGRATKRFMYGKPGGIRLKGRPRLND